MYHFTWVHKKSTCKHGKCKWKNSSCLLESRFSSILQKRRCFSELILCHSTYVQFCNIAVTTLELVVQYVTHAGMVWEPETLCSHTED